MASLIAPLSLLALVLHRVQFNNTICLYRLLLHWPLTTQLRIASGLAKRSLSLPPKHQSEQSVIIDSVNDAVYVHVRPYPSS